MQDISRIVKTEKSNKTTIHTNNIYIFLNFASFIKIKYKEVPAFKKNYFSVLTKSLIDNFSF